MTEFQTFSKCQTFSMLKFLDGQAYFVSQSISILFRVLGIYNFGCRFIRKIGGIMGNPACNANLQLANATNHEQIANLQLANATNQEQIATNHEQIANLQLANATNHEQIAKNKEEMEATVTMLGNMEDLVNKMEERIQILEDLHGNLKVEIV